MVSSPRSEAASGASRPDRPLRLRPAAGRPVDLRDRAEARLPSSGCASDGASSRACARRCCSCCCWPSRPCRARSCRSARATRTASCSTSPTTPTSRRCSTGSRCSTCTRRRGSRRSTCCCSCRSSAASSRARSTTSRRCGRVRRGRPCGSRACRRTPSGRASPRRRGLDRHSGCRDRARGGALKKSGYRVERYDLRGARIRLGRARVPARDRQPHLPHGARGRARGGRDRRRLRLLRAARDRRGPVVREHARGVRLVQLGPLLRRHEAHAVPAHARRARRGVRDREPRRARPGDRLHRARDGGGAGGRPNARSR